MALKSLKVMFVAYHNANFISITEYCEKAIQESVHKCVAFDDSRFILPGRLRNNISLFYSLDLKMLNLRLLACAIREKPDICIVAGGHRVTTETVRALKKRGIKTALWTIDPPRTLDWQNSFYILRKVAPYYDHVFCGGTEAINLLEDLNLPSIHWVPFACDPDFHKPVDVSKQDLKLYGNDLSFVGSFYPNRAKIFEQIADFDLGIWGPGWEKLDFYSPLKKNIKYAGNLKPELWLKIYAAAKLIVITHYHDGKTLCYQVSPKVYEAMACKCTVIVDSQMDISPNFENYKHLCVFNDIDQLRQIIKDLLDNPEKAKQIAEAGYQEVIAKHTYKHRIEKMIKIMTGGS
jgi:spore maturation protein CgeB